MKKIALFLMFIIFLSVNTEAASEYTNNSFNGRFWNSLTLESKQYFMLGMWEGINTFASFQTPAVVKIASSEVEKKIKETFDIFIAQQNYLSPKLAVSEIISKFDKIYANEFNRNIPIGEVYVLVCNEFDASVNGKQVNEEEWLRNLRKTYNK